MSEHIKRAIQDLEEKLLSQMAAVAKTKSAINLLSETIDEPPPYTEGDDSMLRLGVSLNGNRHAKPQTVAPDEFYGKPFSTAVREILQARKLSGGGPASADEIYSVLKQGGYAFDSRDAENQMRGLNVSISKNSAMFVKLPSGLIGLNEWYDTKRKIKVRARNGGTTTSTSDGSDVHDVHNVTAGAESDSDPLP